MNYYSVTVNLRQKHVLDYDFNYSGSTIGGAKGFSTPRQPSDLETLTQKHKC